MVRVPFSKRRNRRYLVQDEFRDRRAAGAVNGTLSTPGRDTRVVVDTDGDKLRIEDGHLVYAPKGVATTGDPALWLAGVARASGRLMVAHYRSSVLGATDINFDFNQAGPPLEGIRTGTNASFLAIASGAGVSVSNTMAIDTDYYFAVVLRSSGAYAFIKGGVYPDWTMVWHHTAGNVATLYPAIANRESTARSKFLRVPDALWLPEPLGYDTFSRGDGAIGSSERNGPDGQPCVSRAWTGATWTVASNEAVNTPGLGAELLADPGLEGNYTAGLCDTFSGVNGAPTVAQSADVHGGTKAQQFTGTGANNRIEAPTGAARTTGNWYSVSIWGKRSAGATGDAYSTIYNGSAYLALRNSAGSSAFTAAAYEQHRCTLRQLANTSGGWRVVYTQAGAAWDTVIVDDLSLKVLTLSTLFSTVEAGVNDVLIDVEIDTLTTATQAGVVLNLDDAANPANFVIAYHDGTNAYLEKCVAGTYTELINTAAAYAAGATLRVIKNGTSYDLFYNGAQVGATQTISDAGIVSNTRHGLFSTYEGNQLDNVTIFARGTGNEYGGLNRWTRSRPGR